MPKLPEKYSISFVLPMYNEVQNIERTVATLKGIASEIAGDHEIVIVDDGSTDGCGGLVESLAQKDPAIRLFSLERNTKFGGAFAKGFMSARKDIIVYMDSDLPVSVDDIKRSLPFIETADIVTGYSSIKKGDTLKRKIMSTVYNAMVQVMFGLNVKDINSGYKIVRRSMLEGIRFISQSPFVDVELFLQAKRKKAAVKQFALLFHPRSGGKSYMGRLPIIWATFRDMFKVRFSYLR